MTIVALAFFAAGVLGNLWDRLFYDGMVRDFIDLYYDRWHWPAFNVADALLCTAVALYLVSRFTFGVRRQNLKKASSAT